MNAPRTIVLRVRAETNVNDLAYAILRETAEFGYVRATGIGAGPMNQIVKAVARARHRIKGSEYDLLMTSTFSGESPPGSDIEWVRVIITIIRVDLSLVRQLLPNNPEVEA